MTVEQLLQVLENLPVGGRNQEVLIRDPERDVEWHIESAEDDDGPVIRIGKMVI